ncbi:MAG: hypothetical protein IJ196_03430 [Prevotella sp.]|nr:hypothetical protein [Prevotella sp.]
MNRHIWAILAAMLLTAVKATAQTDSISSETRLEMPQATPQEDIYSEAYFKQYLRQTPGWRHHRTTKALGWTAMAAGPVCMYSGLFLAFVNIFGDTNASDAVVYSMFFGGAAITVASIPLLRVANRQAVRGRQQAYDLMPSDVASPLKTFRNSHDYRRYRLWKGIGETALVLGITTGVVGSFYIYESQSGHKNPLYTPALVPAGVLIAGSIPCLYASKSYRRQAVGNAMSLSLTAQPMAVTMPTGSLNSIPSLGLAINF